MSLEQTEDLKAFERRLTEVIAQMQPATRKWRLMLVIISVCTAIGAWSWLVDPHTSKVALFQSLLNHPFFTLSCLLLFLLFFAGIHKRVVAPSIIASRCRQVLADYNMSCDDGLPQQYPHQTYYQRPIFPHRITGKLILKPRPTT